MAWKTCFRDILPDVCIGKRLRYAGGNPVTWWEWEGIEASREMLKSAVAGDAAADETEQANTAHVNLPDLHFHNSDLAPGGVDARPDWSKTNEDCTRKLQGS